MIMQHSNSIINQYIIHKPSNSQAKLINVIPKPRNVKKDYMLSLYLENSCHKTKNHHCKEPMCLYLSPLL